MTVAISCNLSDGVILGVDSAVSLPGAGGIAKVYENAEKLFQVGDRPIGIAFFGLGGLGNRSLGSYLREFEVRDPDGVVTGANQVRDVVEGLRAFFFNNYMTTIAPPLIAAVGKPLDQIPPDKLPAFGLAVGGFSSGEYLSEVWQTIIPIHKTPGSAERLRGPGEFGTNWFAMCMVDPNV